ncbi:hypothetical protein [Flavobacterium alkalisoli]|uniref:hypothetical protein n=1 Tax=Flavobacterium alkalisoli TaxID=2602769 RepID=UPI001F0DC812|nr:hypothetical protein [Flavobacterium alkalisoli]
MIVNNLTKPLLLICLALLSCGKKTEDRLVPNPEASLTPAAETEAPVTTASYDTLAKTIHVYVALCDNKYQGIVPVPKAIGNGQDPDNNLYWGCGYGIRTYFKKSTKWKLLKKEKKDSLIMERLVFKHTSKNYYLIADAYNGKHIKQCTKDFLNSSCGKLTDTLTINNTILGIAGNSGLVAYIGHDGLMDFQLYEDYTNTDSKRRNVIILACVSKRFFGPHLQEANVNPLVWTTGLMCPEAYTLHDAITGYVNGENNTQIRQRAAQAYNKYQKCGEKAARNLLVTGWE